MSESSIVSGYDQPICDARARQTHSRRAAEHAYEADEVEEATDDDRRDGRAEKGKQNDAANLRKEELLQYREPSQDERAQRCAAPTYLLKREARVKNDRRQDYEEEDLRIERDQRRKLVARVPDQLRGRHGVSLVRAGKQ